MNINILLLSAGRRVKLFRFLQDELTQVYSEGIVIAADANPEWSAVCSMAPVSIKTPYATDDNFASSIREICLSKNIGLIIPTTDFDTNALVQMVEENLIPEGTKALVSSKELVLKCQDKVLTCAVFKDANVDFLMPLTPEEFDFPIFMKPRYGYNTEDCRVIREAIDLPKSILELEDFGDFIFQYYLSPDDFEEYTIDCYYTLKNHLLCAVPRQRVNVRGGEVSKAITRKNEVYQWVWENFATLEGAQGPITIQCFFHPIKKDIVAGEINPRLGGGYTLSYAAGANYLKMAIVEYMLGETPLPPASWKDELRMLRFDDEIIK